MNDAIEIHQLSKIYPGKKALDRLNLSVPAGAIFALLGDDAWRDASLLRRHVGYVPERPKFYDWMSVNDIGWFTSGFQERGYLKKYRNLIDQFLLDPRARLSTLSKGQYAKVGLALALAIDPEVLILDEPTSGLDLLVRREFLGSMVGLAGQGRTILISSHQVAEIERVASHVAFLSRGKILLAATVEDLRQLVVRVRARCEGPPPAASALGTVLHEQRMGASWQV